MNEVFFICSWYNISMKNSDNKAKNGRYKDPEKRKAYMKKYRQDRKDYYKEYMQKYREEHADYFKKYNEENRDRLRSIQKKYRMKKKEEKRAQQMKHSDQIGDDMAMNVNDLNAADIEDLEAGENPTEDLNEYRE